MWHVVAGVDSFDRREARETYIAVNYSKHSCFNKIHFGSDGRLANPSLRFRQKLSGTFGADASKLRNQVLQKTSAPSRNVVSTQDLDHGIPSSLPFGPRHVKSLVDRVYRRVWIVGIDQDRGEVMDDTLFDRFGSRLCQNA